jgi:predicted O-methyltransferase YrrM
MIYPKNIIEFVKNDPALKERFSGIAAITSLNTTINPPGQDDFSFEEYMLNEGHTRSRAIRKYLHFIASTYSIFNEIFQYFPKENLNSTHKDDVSAIGTAPFELIYHAMYLYCLDSWGVQGDVIECGTYKGFSACCFSWTCSCLGRRLIVADSFEGLPENSTDPYYKKGDFCGQIDEVRSNIEDFGRIEQVDFLKGFYNTSLQGFDRPLCMIWMDVDLYESTMDILNNLLPCLAADGVIISHELFADRDFTDNGLLKDTIGPSKAMYGFFAEQGMTYQAMPLENGSGLVIPCTADEKLLMSCEHVRFLRDRCRQSDEILNHQRTEMEGDILHWRHEVEKLLEIYRSTADFKIKQAVKTVLTKLDLYRKQTDV